MKFLTPSSLVLSLWIAGFASPDFHIVELAGTTEKWGAPSSKYNCGGVNYAIDNNAEIKGSIGSSYMSMRSANLCGARISTFTNSLMNRTSFISNGDGSAQGQCYHNEASKGVIKNCHYGTSYVEKIVCTTYYCK